MCEKRVCFPARFICYRLLLSCVEKIPLESPLEDNIHILIAPPCIIVYLYGRL